MNQITMRRIAPCNRDYRYWPLKCFVDKQKALGAKNIELWLGAPHVIINDEWHSQADKYTNMFRDANITVPVCCSEIAFNRQYFFCSYDELARERAMNHYRQAIDFAYEIGSKILVVNCAGGVLDEDPIRAYHRARFSLQTLAEYAVSKDIILAIENLDFEGGNITHTLSELKELIEDLNNPSVKVCLDTVAMGHQGETLEQWFNVFGEDIVHIHFVDSKQKGRLLWGEGLFPLTSFLQTLNKYEYSGFLGQNYDGYCDVSDEASEKNWKFLQKAICEGK